MAVLRPTNLQPSKSFGTEAIDASIDQIFSARVSSSIDSYRLEIFNNADNSLIEDTGQVSISVEKGETLEVNLPANTINNGLTIKWRITIFDGANSATSFETVVDTAQTPVVGLSISSPVQSQQLTIFPTYSQAQGVDWRHYQVTLRDISGEIRFQSPEITTGALEYTLTGLVDGTTDTVEVVFVSLNGLTATTGQITFTVDYNAPSLNVRVNTVVNCETSGVELSYPAPIIINGTEVGTPSYINNFFATGIIGMRLDTGESVTWSPQGGIPLSATTLLYRVQFIDNTDKLDIVTLRNSTTGAEYRVTYESGTFFSDIDGVRTPELTTTIAGKSFSFILYTTRVRIIEHT